MQTETTTHKIPGRTCAALVAVRGRMLLLLGGEHRWRHDSGYVFVPLELPGGAYPEGWAPEAALAAIGRRWLDRPLRALAADVTYGPSPTHAIDRLPMRDAPAPLLYLERLAPANTERGEGVHRVSVEVFRATIDTIDKSAAAGETGDALKPQPECAGLLLLSWQALRQVVRGLPLAELLAREDVTLQPRPGVALPAQALIYLTGEYGERTLLRIAAKYGVWALGKDVEDGTGF